jgi:predicted DCC family thiol-disulfide oxidoreductase YuxK
VADWRFKLLYDGACPFCRREVGLLSRFNRRGLVALEDISAPGFDPAPYSLTPEEVMGQFCGVFPDGRTTRGPETVRAACGVLGLGWLVAWTGWPLLSPLCDWFYRLYARNRLRVGAWFGRKCAEGTCSLHGAHRPSPPPSG